MSEPSTTEPAPGTIDLHAPVTMSRDTFDLLVNRMYLQGWNDARHWPNQKKPFTLAPWLERNGEMVTKFGAARVTHS